jgi:prepilin-type N-terminal cleavage/methylation domain-containing protein
MKRRHGFTLVELLVSMALIIFIMAILSQAFVTATATFRNLKAAGDMAEKLRATTQLLQRDLSADHFEGKKRLSDFNFWNNGPPQQGYFQVWQGSAGFLEGTDLNGIGSFLSTDHALAFTVKLRGNQMGDFLTANSPTVTNPWFAPPNNVPPANVSLAALIPFYPQQTPPPTTQSLSFAGESRYQANAGTNPTYSYQWGEVTWFMQPSINPATGQQDTTAPDPSTGAAPVPLFTLYRRQRLAVPDNSLVPPQPLTGPTALTANQLIEWSAWQNAASNMWYFNGPIDLTVPNRRFGGLVFPPNTNFQPIPLGMSGLSGSDVQLTDVVSFDVRLLIQPSQGITVPGSVDPFVTLQTVNPTTGVNVFFAYQNKNPIYDPTGTGSSVFDTWTSINDSLQNYSQWNVPSTPTNLNNAAIPLWNGSLTPPAPIIQAIQISIRVWDSKTNQTRQVTMVQAM